MTELQCFHCHKMVQFKEKIGRREECPHCRSDLHVCKNCQFYDPKAYNECRESSADVVKEKDRSNYCDFFSPRTGSTTYEDQKTKLKAAADALFKK